MIEIISDYLLGVAVGFCGCAVMAGVLMWIVVRRLWIACVAGLDYQRSMSLCLDAYAMGCHDPSLIQDAKRAEAVFRLAGYDARVGKWPTHGTSRKQLRENLKHKDWPACEMGQANTEDPSHD